MVNKPGRYLAGLFLSVKPVVLDTIHSINGYGFDGIGERSRLTVGCTGTSIQFGSSTNGTI